MHHRMTDLGVFAVDVPDLAFDIAAQQLVALDTFAAGRGQLDQHGVIALDAAFGEQLRERLEPHIDAFGVVQPVDAEQDLARVADLGPDLPGPLSNVAVTALAVELAGVDGDGEGAHPDGTPVDVHLTESRPHADRTAGGAGTDQASRQ